MKARAILKIGSVGSLLLCSQFGALAQEEKPRDVISPEEVKELTERMKELQEEKRFLLEGRRMEHVERPPGVREQQRQMDQLRRLVEAPGAERMWTLGVALEQGDEGLRVLRAIPGSPAAQAGVREGDRITLLNGLHVRSVGQLRQLIQFSEGDEVVLEVMREGEEHRIAVTPARRLEARWREDEAESGPDHGEEHAEEEDHGDHEQADHEADDAEEMEVLEGIHSTMQELLKEIRGMRWEMNRARANGRQRVIRPQPDGEPAEPVRPPARDEPAR